MYCTPGLSSDSYVDRGGGGHSLFLLQISIIYMHFLDYLFYFDDFYGYFSLIYLFTLFFFLTQIFAQQILEH
jgi:hypothetical protein